ncbi:MAG TPA: DNA-3-methyladenine glycosylase [Terriglobales bacterium]|nr:DNA-3-methyladenine glycosylase [Terriglobales bacterium]
MSARPTTFEAAGLKALPREFFNRDPRRVCRDLLGKLLVRREGRSLLAGRVVEVEAYLGVRDPAAHAYAGMTPRNQVLFGPPGHAYVYFIYGNHYCLNVSCMPEGDAGCVLFRALQPLAGIAEMENARGLEGAQVSQRVLRLLTSGPGRLAQAFGITRPRDNGKDLTDPESDLYLADEGYRPRRVLTTARVGITKAAEKPLRYVIAGNEFVSGKRVVDGS